MRCQAAVCLGWVGRWTAAQFAVLPGGVPKVATVNLASVSALPPSASTPPIIYAPHIDLDQASTVEVE